MDAAIPSYDDECPKNSYSLELAYQESIRKLDLIIKDEAARRLRLCILSLEDENDELHEQLATEDDRVNKLEEECSELRKQVEETEIEIRYHETELKMRARELGNIKAELSSMKGISSDSTKLLTEKLSLARELATLKPELDYLRSQAAHQQSVLAEKLALQRQLNTLEVELETEKRGARRAAHKENENGSAVELHKRIDDLKKELAKEKKEREQAQVAAERSLSESQARKSAIESKFEQQRAKLRETKDQMKSLQTSLAQAQATAKKTTSESASGDIHMANGRKRTAQQISTDENPGTPDASGVRAKRLAGRRCKPDILGEKSMFSITPFLNRTISVTSGMAPCGEVAKAESIGDTQPNDFMPSRDAPFPSMEETMMDAQKRAAKSVSPTVKRTNQKTEKTVLINLKNDRINAKSPFKKSCIVGTLDNVIEEVENENTVPSLIMPPFKALKSLSQPQTKGLKDAEPKKKKRKLLGAVKTLFDEDDGETSKRPVKAARGQVRSLSKDGQVEVKIYNQSGLKAAAGPLSAFSPLKKERRGVQASFLA